MDNTSTSKTQWIIAGVIAALTIIGGTLIIKHGFTTSSTTARSTAATSSANSSTSTPTITITKNGVTGTGGNFTVSLAGSVPTPPDYKSPLQCAASVPSDVCIILQQKALMLSQKIAAKKTDFFAWINLGATRKMAGDTAGAAAAWNYVSKLYPTDSTAYTNLGDLYANFVKDYSKAETNYLKAVKYAPHDTSNYVNLYLLYVNPASTLQSTSSARAILQQGIAVNPSASDLKVWLSRLQ